MIRVMWAKQIPTLRPSTPVMNIPQTMSNVSRDTGKKGTADVRTLMDKTNKKTGFSILAPRTPQQIAKVPHRSPKASRTDSGALQPPIKVTSAVKHTVAFLLSLECYSSTSIELNLG